MTNEIQTYFKSDQILQGIMAKGLTAKEGHNYIASALRQILDPSDKNKLKTCSKQSILNSLAFCAELKLSPEKSQGYIYFIPYKGTCTPMLGARGMKALLLRDKEVKRLSVHIIYEGDSLVYSENNKEGLVYSYTPELFKRKDAKILGVVAFLARGALQHFVRMSKEEVDEIRDKYSKNESFWNNNYEEMIKKTVLRRLYKEIPTLNTNVEEDVAINEEIQSEDEEKENKEKIISPDEDKYMEQKENPEDTPKVEQTIGSGNEWYKAQNQQKSTQQEDLVSELKNLEI